MATATGSSQKVEVRREVADAGAIRITSIGYSDGSVETMKEIKAGVDVDAVFNTSRVAVRSDSGAVFSGKGLMIDQLG